MFWFSFVAALALGYGRSINAVPRPWLVAVAIAVGVATASGLMALKVRYPPRNAFELAATAGGIMSFILNALAIWIGPKVRWH